MKRVRILAMALAFSGAFQSASAQNCSSFPGGNGIVCENQTGSGNNSPGRCCTCIGTESQNESYCYGTPVNGGIVFLGIAGMALGAVVLKRKMVPTV